MKVYRWTVPVDDQWHELPIDKALDLDSITGGIVNVWGTSPAPGSRSFRIFGTGHDVPDGARYEGTTRDGWMPSLVWHLFSKDQ